MSRKKHSGGYYLSGYNDGTAAEDIIPPDGSFSDMDDLLDQWRQFVASELQSFNIIKSDLFGTGCVCDLKKIFQENNTSPDYLVSLMPRVQDCATQCIYDQYNQTLSSFLRPYVNLHGEPMTITDLGEDEPGFYKAFLDVANQRAVWNTWDLFRPSNTLPKS
jgi:hypothetical protein